MTRRDAAPRLGLRGPLATPEATANEPAPFPKTAKNSPFEGAYAELRERLTGNLSRRSDGRREPLTWTDSTERCRPLSADHRTVAVSGGPLWTNSRPPWHGRCSHDVIDD